MSRTNLVDNRPRSRMDGRALTAPSSSGQDAALSRLKHGFKSRRGHQDFSRLPRKPCESYLAPMNLAAPDDPPAKAPVLSIAMSEASLAMAMSPLCPLLAPSKWAH